MRHSLKNGFVRLAIVFFVGWSLVWGVLIYRASAEVESWRLANDYDTNQPVTNWDDWKESYGKLAGARGWLAFVEKVGIGGLFVIPAAFASSVWVWFGFKKQISN